MHYNTHVNHEEIENDTERTIKFKPFIKKKKINGKEKLIHEKKMIGKNLREKNITITFNVCIQKKKIYILPKFQNIIQTVRNKLTF